MLQLLASVHISEFDWIYVTQHIVNLQWVGINISFIHFSIDGRYCCRYHRWCCCRTLFTFVAVDGFSATQCFCLIFVFHRHLNKLTPMILTYFGRPVEPSHDFNGNPRKLIAIMTIWQFLSLFLEEKKRILMITKRKTCTLTKIISFRTFYNHIYFQFQF